MAFSLTDITTTGDVRAMLGVSEPELPDAALLVPSTSVLLSEALYALHPQMLADFKTVNAIAAASQTPDQARFLALVSTWASCWAAQHCLNTVQMFAPTDIKDTKTEIARTPDAYKNLRRDVGATLSTLRINLLTMYPAINPSALAPTPVERLMVLTAGLGTDPVTGA